MSQYLTEEEIPKYCSTVPNVTINDVIIASNLIDGYLGYSFSKSTTSETVTVNNRFRGKLKNKPILSIDKVYQLVRTAISISRNEVKTENVYVDVENDGYFSYVATSFPFAMNTFCGNRQPIKLEVTYSYGYDEIPEDIKVVTGMLAQNISQIASFAGYKKLTTLDYTIEMGNPSFFTADMRQILTKYKGI